MRRIVLVGFPGSGKTSAGRKIAKAIGWQFLDMDLEFEKNYNQSISEFLNKFGEPYFRECENSLLKLLLKKEYVVLSTGGGTPCFYGAMDLIKETSLSIYIKMSNQSLYDRIINSKKQRPLTDGMNEETLKIYIENTIIKREPFYAEASIIVKGESLHISDLILKIRKLIVKNPGIDF